MQRSFPRSDTDPHVPDVLPEIHRFPVRVAGWRANRVCDSDFRRIARIILFIFMVVGQTLSQLKKKGPNGETELLSTKASRTEDELSSKILKREGFVLFTCALYYFSLLFFINVFFMYVPPCEFNTGCLNCQFWWGIFFIDIQFSGS